MVGILGLVWYLIVSIPDLCCLFTLITMCINSYYTFNKIIGYCYVTERMMLSFFFVDNALLFIMSVLIVFLGIICNWYGD